MHMTFGNCVLNLLIMEKGLIMEKVLIMDQVLIVAKELIVPKEQMMIMPKEQVLSLVTKERARQSTAFL